MCLNQTYKTCCIILSIKWPRECDTCNNFWLTVRRSSDACSLTLRNYRTQIKWHIISHVCHWLMHRDMSLFIKLSLKYLWSLWNLEFRDQTLSFESMTWRTGCESPHVSDGHCFMSLCCVRDGIALSWGWNVILGEHWQSDLDVLWFTCMEMDWVQ